MRRIGILGGSFNPPHLGHRELARHAREQLGLGRVLLMPVHVAPHKSDLEDPGPQHRLEMCRLLIGDTRGLTVCGLEVDRGGASYTVDTLEALHASHPEAELTFIVGADTASTLPAWHEPERLIELAGLAVAARAGSTRQDVLDRVASIGNSSGPVFCAAPGPAPDLLSGERRKAPRSIRFLEMPVMEVSSSMARERAAAGLPIAEIVGPEVARYIEERGLYRPREEESH